MGVCVLFGCWCRAAAMWIQVRTMDGKETHRVDSLSKLTKVDELRLKIMEIFKVEPERQRLFYRGKQVRHWRRNDVPHCFSIIASVRALEGSKLLNDTWLMSWGDILKF